MNKLRTALATAVLVALAGMSTVQAADIIPVVTDPANFGYNDPTPVAPVGGNPGTTLGQQRQIVAQYAAAMWGSVLKSDVPVYIQARFLSLAPNVLGSAGTLSAFRDYPGMPFAGTWYPGALADSLVGADLNPGFYDIRSQFSTNFTFYYGLDGKTPANQTNFLDVVMHEYAHGLGFANFENEATGAFFQGLPDAYSQFTYDNTQAKYWVAMTQAERATSGLNYGNVVFTGANATAGAKLLLDDRKDFRVTAPGLVAGNYTIGSVTFGPLISTSNFNGNVVLGSDGVNEPAVPPGVAGTANDGCSPLINAAAMAGKIVLLDRGYCAIAVKTKNAQNAGAIGVIIANNAAANPPPNFSGADATITIPTIVVTQAAGTSFKANLPLTVTYVIDATKWQGADDLGRPRLFMPNPVQGGSSGSHYDSNALPNLLMEPAINPTLRSYYNLDITPALLKDIGWQLNTASAKIGSPSVPDCDTGLTGTTDGGLFVAGTIQANNELCLVTAQTRGGYYSCMDAARDRMVSSGVVTALQGNKMMMCAKRVQDHQVFPLALPPVF